MNRGTPIGGLTLVHQDGAQALAVAHELGGLYAEVYRGTPQETDPFYSAARFAERLPGYARAPGFRLVVAREGGALVGYAFGYRLPAGSRWWEGLVDPVPDGFTEESGHRTFALCELHVRADWRGKGLASRLHAELLKVDAERATVLVRQDNPALNIYTHWGYEQVGRLQPYADSPVFAALVLLMRP